MVAGLKFLSKKAFNPQNQSNQKRVWEREQQAEIEAKRLRDRNEQLKRERDDEELALARGDSLKVDFLYQAPPGLAAAATKGDQDDNGDAKPSATGSSSNSHDVVAMHRQPGDDDAAAAFRAMLAGQLMAEEESNNQQQQQQQQQQDEQQGFSFALRGSDADPHGHRHDGDKDSKQQQRRREPSTLTALEKAAGRANNKRDGLTLESQIERFPSLANAPRAKGISSENIGVNFKPMGAQIRNVKCLACGLWGHARGERECKKSGWNPFEMTTRHDDETERLNERLLPSKAESSRMDYSDSDSGESYRRERKRKHKRRSSLSKRLDGDTSDLEDSRRKRKNKHKKHKKNHHDDDRKRHKRSK